MHLSLFQDAQDLGISIELLPLSPPDEEFKVSHFYAVSPHLCHFIFSGLPWLIDSFTFHRSYHVAGYDWTGS